MPFFYFLWCKPYDMQKLHLLIGLTLLINMVKAQPINTYAATNASVVNKQSPNFVFDTLLNYKKEKLALADWKGKRVIIDFWSTSCLPCIADFPKLEGFQKKFGDSLQILLAAQGFEKTSRFYETRKKMNKPVGLPCAMAGEAFDYFKVRSVSTYVWIDEQGYVKAITDYSQVTEHNVADFTAGKNVRLRQIGATSLIEPDKYLVTIANEMDSSNIVFNSALTKYLDGISASRNNMQRGNGTKVHVTNYPIIGFYTIAYGDATGPVPLSRVSNETAQPDKYIPPKGTDYQEWKKDNTFCYELTVPLNRKNDIFKIMQDDLKRMFGFTAYMEDRVQKCLVLTAEKNGQLMADSSLAPKIIYNTGGITLINHPFARLFEMIHHYNQDKIILDETGITGKVAVTLLAQMDDIESLNEALKKYGLHLAYKDRTVKMLVFKDPVK